MAESQNISFPSYLQSFLYLKKEVIILSDKLKGGYKGIFFTYRKILLTVEGKEYDTLALISNHYGKFPH